MDAVIQDRLAYCDNCQQMRPVFQAEVPILPESSNKRPAYDYVCGVCYNIVATFEIVTQAEWQEAAKEASFDMTKAAEELKVRGSSRNRSWGTNHKLSRSPAPGWKTRQSTS